MMMCTLEEFQDSLDEDEFVVGDSFWLKGTRRRFAFTVTNVDPFEPSCREDGKTTPVKRVPQR